MTVTYFTEIRDLLNRPANLVEGAITEYITMRTQEADKIARTGNIRYSHQQTQYQLQTKRTTSKPAVCADVLVVLINTLPAHHARSKARNRRQVSQTTRTVPASELLTSKP